MAISRQDKPRFVPRASKAKDSGLCSDIFPSRSRSFLSVMRSYTCRKVEFRRQLHVVDVGVREAEAAKPSCRCVGRRKPRETLISAGRRHLSVTSYYVCSGRPPCPSSPSAVFIRHLLSSSSSVLQRRPRKSTPKSSDSDSDQQLGGRAASERRVPVLSLSGSAVIQGAFDRGTRLRGCGLLRPRPRVPPQYLLASGASSLNQVHAYFTRHRCE